MASLYRDLKRSQSWIACFRGPDGRQVQRSTGLRHKKDAQAMAESFEFASRLAQKGELVAETARTVLNEILFKVGCSPLQDMITEEWCRGWLTDKKSSTAESTQIRYAQIIDEFLGAIGKKASQSIQFLSVADVRLFRDNLRKSGVSAKSIRVALKVVRACFTAAVNQGYRTHNPGMAVDLPNGTSIKKKAFSLSQVQLLLQNAPDWEWKTLIKFGFYIGGRLLITA